MPCSAAIVAIRFGCDCALDFVTCLFRSLHSCFSSTHGAECGTCLKELYYTYTMNKQGKTARQIRAGIIKGDWKLIDLETAATIN